MFKSILRKLLNNIKEKLERKKISRQRIWHSFCHETPLQGFQIYWNSQFRYERAIWLLLVAVAIGVTMNDSIRTIRQFMDEETLSKVTMEQNDSIVLPNPTICLELNFLKNDFDTVGTNASEVRDFLRNNKNKILHIYGPLVQKLDETNEDGIDNATNYLMEEPDFSIYLMEVILSALGTAQYADGNLMYSSVNFIGFLGTYWNSAVEVFRFLDKNNLNYGDVMKSTASYLCRLAKLFVDGPLKDLDMRTRSYAQQSKTNYQDWCNRNNVVLCYRLKICFRTPLHPSVFNFSNDDRQSSAYVFVTPRLPKYLDVERILINFDRTFDRFIVDSSASNSITVTSKNPVHLEIEIITTQYYSTSKSPCDNTNTWMDCCYRCQNDVIKQKCGCVWISLFYLNCPEATVCREEVCLNGTYNNQSDKYLSTSKCIKDVNVEFYKCYKNCFTPCLLLNLHLSKVIENEQDGVSKTFLELRLRRQSYLSIVQTLAMDWQTFMSNLGGNLGLYIGGTLLALIHLFTSVIRLIVSLLVAKDDHETDQVESNEHQQSVPKQNIGRKKPKVDVVAKLLALEADMAALKEENKRIRE